jgi:hypothetical protein
MPTCENRIRVFRPFGWGDWEMICDTHPHDNLVTYSWESAYEAAVGHAVMHHPRES